MKIELTEEQIEAIKAEIESQDIKDLKERINKLTEELFLYEEKEHDGKTPDQLKEEMHIHKCRDCRFYGHEVCPCAKPELYRKPMLEMGDDGILRIKYANACEEFEWD